MDSDRFFAFGLRLAFNSYPFIFIDSQGLALAVLYFLIAADSTRTGSSNICHELVYRQGYGDGEHETFSGETVGKENRLECHPNG